jgi:hypothetical protein
MRETFLTEVGAAEWCISWDWIACWAAACCTGVASRCYSENRGVEIVVSAGGVGSRSVVPDDVDTGEVSTKAEQVDVSKTDRFIELSLGA